MSGKVERLPGWAFRRLNAPGPARRAELKLVLRWRRTRDETLALASELLARGLVEKAVADRLEVSDRYLRRLLAEPAESGLDPAEIDPANPHRERAELALTREYVADARPARRAAPAAGFASFGDLDRWLDEAGS